MAYTDNYPEKLGTGNAEAPQKLEIRGFSEEVHIWAWNTFKSIAKNLSKKNYFGPEDRASMEAIAIGDILSDGNICWEAAGDMTLEQYLAGVFSRKLRHAAAQVADERSVWTESRRSLDMPSGADEDSGSLVDILADDANLAANVKFFEKPRAIEVRDRIKRLRDRKDYEGLAKCRASLKGFEYAPGCDDKDDPRLPSRIASRSPGFGHSAARPVEVRERAEVFNRIIATLDPKAKEWCRLCREGEDPVLAYKLLGIDKNHYYRKLLPMLKKLFAEYRRGN